MGDEMDYVDENKQKRSDVLGLAPLPEPKYDETPGRAKASVPSAAPSEKLIKTEFVYADGAVNDVKVSGSWNKWIPVQLHYEGDGLWSVLTPVPAGGHEFRFIVDGEWKVSTHHPTVGDESDDTVNNYREVTLPPPPKEKPVKVKGREWNTVKRRNCVIM